MSNENVSPTKINGKNLFFSGVIILTIANILVKSVGLISKVVLNNVVGPIGAGYYSSAYEIYAYLYVISTAGLPIAISILVSKSRANGRMKEARKIFEIAFLIFLAIGLLLSVLLILFSSQIATLLGAPETKYAIIAVAPTVLLVCLSSCMRGYFQGYQLMVPTAASQFIEAACKVAIMVAFALWAKSRGLDDYMVASYTILGVTFGVFFGTVYLYVRKMFFREKVYCLEYCNELDNSSQSTSVIVKSLFKIAIPITLSSSVLSLTTIIDTFMLQTRLSLYGLDSVMIKTCYGDYTSLVISMANLPTILLYPIASALVPLISASREKGDREGEDKMKSFSMRVTLIIAFPCAMGLGVFAKPILNLLMFRPDSVERAHMWLSISAVSVIFLGLISITNAFLNSAGYQFMPIISMICGAIVKLVANYFLIAKIGMYGAPVSTVLCYLTASCLNIFFVLKYTGKLPNIATVFLLPFVCSTVAVSISCGVYLLTSPVIPKKIATVLSIIIAVIAYVFLIIRTKSVKEEEILLLPNGDKIYNLLKKLKVLPKTRQNI